MKKIIKILVFALPVTCYLLPVYCSAQIITTIAGTGTAGYTGNGGQATAANMYGAEGMIFDNMGNLYFADVGNSAIRMINTNGIITTITGGNGPLSYGGDGGPATNAKLAEPTYVVFDMVGNILVADDNNGIIRRINTAGIINTIAGMPQLNGYGGDGGQATNAYLNHPTSVICDNSGNIFIDDGGDFRVRKVNTSGIITPFAGDGVHGNNGDGGQATLAKLEGASSIVFDMNWNLYIGTEFNIRKVDTNGIISTIAGGVVPGYSGDGGQATNAELDNIDAMVFDNAGNLFIADASNNVVRKISTAGIITTIVGNGYGAGAATGGYSGDGGPATAAELFYPKGLTFDAQGNLYIGDYENNVIRKVSNVGSMGIAQVRMQNAECRMWPNPTSTILNVECRIQNEKAEVQIMDVLGNVIISTKEKEIDVSSLTNGVYFIRVGSATQKIIIQH